MDEIAILFWRMHITFQSLICDSCSLRILLLWQSVSALFFPLVITPCGWRLGKRRLQQPITVVSLSRRRVPTVCSPSFLSEKHPLYCSSPICQDHSFQIDATLSRGLVSAFQRAMIAAKADKKPKCRRSLISFEESYLPLVFWASLSHDPISLSFKVFWCPIDLYSFTPWFPSLLMSFQLFIISALSGRPVYHSSPFSFFLRPPLGTRRSSLMCRRHCIDPM